MRNVPLIFMAALALFASVSAESLLKPVNEAGFGTVSLRAQTLSMYRDYEGRGSGYSTTLGWKLDYLTPEWKGFSAGLSGIHVDVLQTAGGAFGRDGEGLLFNGRVNELNEAWLKYSFGSIGLSNTFVKAGRQVINSEVFRSDEFRQKPRSLEAVMLSTKDLIPNTSLMVGHADRLSNIWDSDSTGNRTDWRFKDIEDVLGANYTTRGVSWAEGVFTGVEDLEVAAYDAYAYQIVNAAGGRMKYDIADATAINGYYRHETPVGKGTARSDMIGASIQQKVGGVTLEPGYFSVRGDNLVFEEIGTGINHPLGASMMLYGGQFLGGSDTYYLKATAKIDKTVLYMLYNYTTQERATYTGQELNVVVKQPIGDRLTLALKVGAGYHDENNKGNTTATDTRLFVTYNF